MKYSQGMDFVHHALRPIWNFPIGLIYFLVCVGIWVCSKKTRLKVRARHIKFFSHDNVTAFASWFKDNYEYRWDGFGKFVEWLESKRTNRFIYNYKILDLLIKIFSALRGLLDHDNWFLEYLMWWGDCDDCRHIMKALKKMPHVTVFRIGMIGETINSWHYSVIIHAVNWQFKEEYILFNYGNLVHEISIEDCLKKFCELPRWDKLYKAETMKWWKCKY